MVDFNHSSFGNFSDLRPVLVYATSSTFTGAANNWFTAWAADTMANLNLDVFRHILEEQYQGQNPVMTCVPLSLNTTDWFHSRVPPEIAQDVLQWSLIQADFKRCASRRHHQWYLPSIFLGGWTRVPLSPSKSLFFRSSLSSRALACGLSAI